MIEERITPLNEEDKRIMKRQRFILAEFLLRAHLASLCSHMHELASQGDKKISTGFCMPVRK
jgi:hypothetical protein